ncbi:MAG: hypothetical protein ACPG8V_03855 [Alphaproteobacteria bacterium]
MEYRTLRELYLAMNKQLNTELNEHLKNQGGFANYGRFLGKTPQSVHKRLDKPPLSYDKYCLYFFLQDKDI